MTQKTVTEKLADVAPLSHKHTVADMTDFPSTMKNPNSIKIQINSGIVEGSSQFTYDGSDGKAINITASSLGLGNVDNTKDDTKTVKSAAFPVGFNSRDVSAAWGTHIGTLVTDWSTKGSGDIQFRENDGKLYVLIDGYYYQNEGSYRCLDTNNFSEYAATKEHTHDYIPLSGTKSLTGDIVPTTWCTINLGNSSYPFSSIGCWQGMFIDPSKGQGDTSQIQVIGTPMDNKKCGIVFGNPAYNQKQLLLTPPSQANMKDSLEITLPNTSGTLARLEDLTDLEEKTYLVYGYDEHNYEHTFSAHIGSSTVGVIFTDEEMPSGATVVTGIVDDTLFAWCDPEHSLRTIISTGKKGKKVKCAVNAKGMFNGSSNQNALNILK